MIVSPVFSFLFLTMPAATASPISSTLKLDQAFYDWECSDGSVEVTVKTYECSETGLYQLTAQLTSKAGRIIEVNLSNDQPCQESLWTARVTELRCIDQVRNNLAKVSVTAQVDPVLWKEALGY